MTMEIGNQVMYMADEFPELGVKSPTTLGGNSTSIVINVPNADATWAHAVEAGAFGERPVTAQHGARSGWFTDPWGHRWCPTSAEVPDRS
jgi:PhnB protein